MTQSSAYSFESHFGPPSDPVVIKDFIQRCESSKAKLFSYDPLWRWSENDEEQNAAIANECSMGDVKKELSTTLSKPLLWSYLVKQTERNFASIYASAQAGSGSARSKKRKRTRSSVSLHDEENENGEVAELRKDLGGMQLKSWPYPPESASFMRLPKNSDQNAFNTMRSSGEYSSSMGARHDAILLFSVHTRLSWGNHLSRSSQHSILASQTLKDLYDVIPCPAKEIPSEKFDGEKFVGYKENEQPEQRGAVFCIEGVAHGDGLSEEDYADKLLRHIEAMPEAKRPTIKKGPSIMEQTLATLALRLNEPYWLLHQGHCEHFLVIDQIRLLHPSDPEDGYPLTLHVTPSTPHMCQACTRVPAVWSISGDIRLGQSPCALCVPCWRNMGLPKGSEAEGVITVPLLMS